MMSHPHPLLFDENKEPFPQPPHPPQQNKRIRIIQMLLLLLSQEQFVPQFVAVKSLMLKASIFEICYLQFINMWQGLFCLLL